MLLTGFLRDKPPYKLPLHRPAAEKSPRDVLRRDRSGDQIGVALCAVFRQQRRPEIAAPGQEMKQNLRTKIWKDPETERLVSLVAEIRRQSLRQLRPKLVLVGFRWMGLDGSS